MARFVYTARDSSGRSVNGDLDAPSRRDALRRLQARGLQPVRLDENSQPVTKAGGKGAPASGQGQKPAKPAASHAPAAPVRLSRKQRLPFLEALADLVRSGMSAGEAIRLLALRIKDPRLRQLSTALWTRLGEGLSLSGAMGEYREVFDTQTINLVAAGEATGNLRDVLERLIKHFTEQKELRQKLLAALAYPVFICVLAGGVILFFLFFLLPRLQGLLTSLGGNLPLSTQILATVAHGMLRYGGFGVAGAVMGGIAFWRWRASPAGKITTDRLLLRVPVVKDYIVRSTVLGFSHTLAVLLENGITTADALRLAERTILNTALREALHSATDRVLEGESLAISLGRTGLFPDLLIDRLAVGEQTGNLAPSLRDVARSYQNAMDRWLQTFTRTVSGGVLMAAFLFVAFIAYAIVSAVLQVSTSFRF
jgi:general secretion pathway protein F